jgi:hypothetical protein
MIETWYKNKNSTFRAKALRQRKCSKLAVPKLPAKLKETIAGNVRFSTFCAQSKQRPSTGFLDMRNHNLTYLLIEKYISHSLLLLSVTTLGGNQQVLTKFYC